MSELLTEPLRFIMFGPKKSPATSHVIGASMHVTGDCHFQGQLQLEGTVVGNVIADASQPSSVHVGVSARVEGAVHANHIVVAGTIVGAVVATQRLELHSSSRIEGDVSYQAMDMRPGATVIGSFQPQLIAAPVLPEPETTSADAAPPQAGAASEPTEPTLDPQQPLQSHSAVEQVLLIDPEQPA